MLVKKYDLLSRHGKTYEVVCCDEQFFIIGPQEYIPEEECFRVDFTKLEAYSNDESVNTLAQLHFAKRIKAEKRFD